MTAAGTRSEIERFLADHVARASELSRRANEAYWTAATTGSEAASKESARLQAELRKLYSIREDAATVANHLERPSSDPILRRQLVVLSLAYRANQLPPEVIDDLSTREAELVRLFATRRPEFEGEPVADNVLREVLRTERDEARRQRAWEASKEIGGVIRDDLVELVRRRNRAAREAGFQDFYQMGLELQEQDETHLFRILDDFKTASDTAFGELLDEIESVLSARFQIDRTALRPWHREDVFSQEAPSFTTVDLDRFYAEMDQESVTASFLRGIGLEADDILAAADLFEREDKNQHAFCIDVDRSGDVRVLCNLRPNEHWTMVLLHEMGHAVYDKYIPASMPWVLREPAHTFSTEAIAMYLGRLTRDPKWIEDVRGITIEPSEAAEVRAELRARMLVSLRWMLVMAHFERALYRDPERDDLNALWWDLVEEMQGVRRPDGRDAPDWATKIHLTMAPAYYHNYLLGELMASQLSQHIDQVVRSGETERSIAGDQRVGDYLREKVFAPGRSLDWNELLIHATGEGLDPRHFIEQFIDPARTRQ